MNFTFGAALIVWTARAVRILDVMQPVFKMFSKSQPLNERFKLMKLENSMRQNSILKLIILNC